MFNKTIISLLLLISSPTIFAMSCFETDLRTYKYEKEIQPRLNYTVNVHHRVYFHSAPKKSCKIEDSYVIHNDQVMAYSRYKDEANQEWIYVMYINTEHDDDESDDLIEGWVLSKDLKLK